MHLENKYVDCEDGCSQYDNYDLGSNNIVDAVYVHAKLDIDKGNPYIEALPLPRNEVNINLAYTRISPSYDYDTVKTLSPLDKMLQVGLLRQVRFPLSFHKSLEFNFYNSILTSYRARIRVVSKNKSLEYEMENQPQNTNCVLYGDSGDATNAGFSLIGYSGCGKSSAISTLVSHYPQVIMHDDADDGYFPQITYLIVNCVTNSNFSALYEGIGDAIDKAFGNTFPVYAKEISRTSGLGRKAEKIKTLVEKFAIGIIIFDEIQLLDFTHTRENTFDSLLTLANRTKVAVAVVGTEDARSKMFHELRTSRRIGPMINGNSYCENKKFFRFLVRQLFKYQWFDEVINVTEDITDALYDVTKGIVDQLIGIYSCMNYDYLDKKKKPEIDGEYVREIAKKYYPGMQNVLADLEDTENAAKLMSMRNNAEMQVTELIEKARQEKEANHIIKNTNAINNHAISLKNITSSILTLYDEFTEMQVQDAFTKVMSKKGTNALSEREIAKLVVNQLQKAAKPHKSREKMIQPDIEHMKDFLGLGKGEV